MRTKTDPLLFWTIVGLMVLGVLYALSTGGVAELRFGSRTHYFVRQFSWALVSAALMQVVRKEDYRYWNRHVVAYGGAALCAVLLVGVYLADPRSHRWLRAGYIGLQPSEMTKVALVVYLSYELAHTRSSARFPARIAVVVAILTTLVLAADMGTFFVLLAVALAMVWVAGLPARKVMAVIAVLLLATMIGIVSEPYRLARVAVFFQLKPEGTGRLARYLRQSSAPQTGYQVRQSLIAVGSGGVLGRGFNQSRQKLLFLPECQTDFVFSVMAEELGLLGCLTALGGFCVIVWRGLATAMRTRDAFGRYLAVGATLAIGFQALLNISVALGMFPTQGVPLPLLSYGGSSLVVTGVMSGLLLSVAERPEVEPL